MVKRSRTSPVVGSQAVLQSRILCLPNLRCCRLGFSPTTSTSCDAPRQLISLLSLTHDLLVPAPVHLPRMLSSLTGLKFQAPGIIP